MLCLSPVSTRLVPLTWLRLVSACLVGLNTDEPCGHVSGTDSPNREGEAPSEPKPWGASMARRFVRACLVGLNTDEPCGHVSGTDSPNREGEAPPEPKKHGDRSALSMALIQGENGSATLRIGAPEISGGKMRRARLCPSRNRGVLSSRGSGNNAKTARTNKKWPGERDSNPRHPVPKTGALSAELPPGSCSKDTPKTTRGLGRCAPISNPPEDSLEAGFISAPISRQSRRSPDLENQARSRSAAGDDEPLLA